MKVLHIIDASNHVYRGASIPRPYYYGQEMKNGVLESVSVLCGGFNALMNYIPMLQKDYFGDPEVENHYAICFDSRSKTIKKQENAFYKANRTYDSSTCPHAQMQYAESLLNLYGYVVCREEGYEADDIAYSLWRKCKKYYSLIVLHSSDKDWSFMIDDDTIQFAKRKNRSTGRYEYEIIDVTNYKQTFGVEYNCMLLDKVLRGDPSDGVKGIGMKQLPTIQQFCLSDIANGELGDIRKMRELLLAAGRGSATFPVDDALSILEILTPEIVDVDEYVYQLSEARPKQMPFNYITSMKPQNRTGEHRELFYDFVEASRTER